MIPLLPQFHHAGYVVDSIVAHAPRFAASLSLSWNGVIIHDPLQMVRVSFLPSLLPSQATIELVEPTGKRSPVRRFLESGGGLHHVCYEVHDLAAQLAASQAVGDTLVRVPLPAAAFENRKIAWVKTSFGVLVEFLESPPPVHP